MDNLDAKHPGYGFAKHKGYPVPEHLAALKALGACSIHPPHSGRCGLSSPSPAAAMAWTSRRNRRERWRIPDGEPCEARG